MADIPDPALQQAESPPVTPPFVSVPDHELIRLIGRGSYGEVWLAKNTLGAFRAVKIVYEKTFRHKRPFDREFNGVSKFEPISRLHEGLMDILHVGRNEAAGFFYCVMELADDVCSGQAIDPGNYSPRTLAADLAKHRRLPIRECQRIGIAIASALEFLHQRGLIHRDVKPSNIVFVNGVPKLADIGLVAEMSEARSYVGTAGFIPPEGPGTAQADIYSLGKVLYEISTGKDRHDYPELPTRLDDPVDEDELPDFNQIIIKACRADPGQRYKSAHALVEGLSAGRQGTRHGPGGSARRIFWRAATVAAGLGIVAIIFWRVHPRPPPPGTPAIVVPGLVSRWAGDGSAVDGAGKNNGKIPGDGSVTYGPGVAGRAFVFDGFHRDGVDVGNPTNLQLQDFTIEAWIKRASVTNISLDGDAGSIFVYGHEGYGLCLVRDGRVALSKIDVDAVFSTNTITDLNWHHVAVSRAGSMARIYIDGAPDSEPVAYDTIFQFNSSAAIGARGDWAGCSFLGSIDELAIYRRALSATEIQAIYDAGSEGARPPAVRPSAEGLIAAWPAEGQANDVRGNHHGTLTNGVTFAAGKVGKAFSFDGKKQYVQIPWSPDLDVGPQLTLEFWMKADAGNSMHTFQGLVSSRFYGVDISSGYKRRTGVNFVICTDGGKSFSANSYPDTADANEGGAVIEAGQWHHVAGTYDGARLQLFIDGRPSGKPMLHSGTISPAGTNSFLALGSEEVSPANEGRPTPRYFNGLLDEIHLYNRALSPGEIRFIYEAGVSSKDPLILQQK